MRKSKARGLGLVKRYAEGGEVDNETYGKKVKRWVGEAVNPSTIVRGLSGAVTGPADLLQWVATHGRDPDLPPQSKEDFDAQQKWASGVPNLTELAGEYYGKHGFPENTTTAGQVGEFAASLLSPVALLKTGKSAAKYMKNYVPGALERGMVDLGPKVPGLGLVKKSLKVIDNPEKIDESTRLLSNLKNRPAHESDDLSAARGKQHSKDFWKMFHYQPKEAEKFIQATTDDLSFPIKSIENLPSKERAIEYLKTITGKSGKRTFNSPDGYKFYEQPDGSWTDAKNGKNFDMSFGNVDGIYDFLDIPQGMRYVNESPPKMPLPANDPAQGLGLVKKGAFPSVKVGNQSPELMSATKDVLNGVPGAREARDAMIPNYWKANPLPKEIYDLTSEEQLATKIKSNLFENRKLKSGTIVDLRPDINSAKGAGNTTRAITVHESSNGEKPGKVIGYDSHALLDNFTVKLSPKTSGKIAVGQSKEPSTRLSGSYTPTSQAEAKALAQSMLDDPNVRQVTFNPHIHEYAFDIETGQAVTGGKRALSYGHKLLVDTPTYADPKTYRYATGGPVRGLGLVKRK